MTSWITWQYFPFRIHVDIVSISFLRGMLPKHKESLSLYILGILTCRKKATTMTVMKRVAVSKSWKFRSMGFPIIHPTTTQKGIWSNGNNRDLRRYHAKNKILCDTNRNYRHISKCMKCTRHNKNLLIIHQTNEMFEIKVTLDSTQTIHCYSKNQSSYLCLPFMILCF